MHSLSLLPNLGARISKSERLDLINVFKTDCKYGSHGNYFELFILPNGSLFISEALLDEILDKAGVEGLIFLLLQ
jgi:hypothetical protein